MEQLGCPSVHLGLANFFFLSLPSPPPPLYIVVFPDRAIAAAAFGGVRGIGEMERAERGGRRFSLRFSLPQKGVCNTTEGALFFWVLESQLLTNAQEQFMPSRPSF